MKKPKISIIIPIYNSEQYLCRCIESILNQTYSDFELLLINDGSKDGSSQICQKYELEDKRVHLFEKENGGVSSARNYGIDHANGEWIGFCDSDDWVKDKWLEDFIKIEKDGDLLSQGFFSSNWANSDAKSITESDCIVTGIDMQKFLIKLMYTSQIGFIWCKLFKKSIIDENNIRFNKKIVFLEDQFFVLSYCFNINTIANIHSCNYQYKFAEKGKYFGRQDTLFIYNYVIDHWWSETKKDVKQQMWPAVIYYLIWENSYREKRTNFKYYRWFIDNSRYIKWNTKDIESPRLRLFLKLYQPHVYYLYVLISMLSFGITKK